MEKRIRELLERFEKVEELLGRPEAVANQKEYRELTQEHSYLSEIKEVWGQILQSEKRLLDDQALVKTETDPELLDLLREEIQTLEATLKRLHPKLENLLVPPDPLDSRNVIMEIRAGTGGDEAALFVGDCVRMYKYYADKKGWKYENLSAAESERGGFKEYIMVLSGPNVYRELQYEAGTHRVQRIPETEAQGRIHTSAVTIAVLPEPTEDDQLDVDEKDLRIETYRASGAGGQHVNTTDSAVRITHIPTGVIVACQDERSQHKNRDKAMRLLVAKIAEEKRRKDHEAMSSLRSSQVGSGDRSERIRTYNFPQNRVTDHRINLTLYNLTDVLEGKLDEFTNALVTYFYQQKLSGNEDAG
jgi:peptide chain release factor 1